MKLHLLRLFKIVIIFIVSILLLKFIPTTKIPFDDIYDLAICFVLLFTLFETFTPSYTIVVDQNNENVLKVN